MSANKFDIDTSPETPELLAIAKEQLRETPEIREKAIVELRELLKNSDLIFSDDDEFLTIILRKCHWYTDGAMQLVKSSFSI